ncbi:tRNA (guanosine(37)-N1)-methyltransferase TrmD [Bdellovibrio sp. HCB337]|uniref:tRNA (guanosine(37)-N1)-methyltransferase TrmD n=1 Tax=Bdellovibrio sp. HCB337 TaxID=3394358 RepID=UPI0039A5D307
MAFHFQVITVFPEMIQAAMAAGVFSQAQKSSLLELSCINPREFTTDVHRTVDDRPFGGGDGMIMLPEPLQKSIEKAKAQQPKAKVIYLSPQGKPLTHQKAQALSQESGLVLLCGRYGGIDQRIINQFVDEELSTGDYVISGGELAACVVMDAVSRFVPGVLGHKDSVDKDSFAEGLLEHPNYTRPREYQGESVPEVLFSGHHKKINEWKELVSYLVTLQKRPDLIDKSKTQKTLKEAYKYWQGLSPQERDTLGLKTLKDEDFHG